MAWHPTLSTHDSKTDHPWDRARPLTDTQWRESRLETIGSHDVCWCGLEAFHEWEGQADGKPHPRARAS
jgi:hypothetical protein